MRRFMSSAGVRDNAAERPAKASAVFYVSLAVTLALAICAALGGEGFSEFSNQLMASLEGNFGWLYLLAMFAFVVFSACVAFSRFGDIRLGPEESRPEHSTPSWLAMLFCAGMGIGLVFWGVAEPISHYLAPAAGIDPATPEAANFAMEACFMHWGFQPWAAYAVIGLGLAYAHFRKGRPFLVSSLLAPVWGKSDNAALRHTIDVFAAIVTVAGVSTSLGLGCLQISAGSEFLFGIKNEPLTWCAIIAVICLIYSISAVSGVNRGVKRLSSWNAIFALAFAAVCFVLGPTLLDLNIFTTTLGSYIQGFLKTSLDAFPFDDNTWLVSWRIFYWAWWIAWTPFVGMFIARISKGRTVREFVLGVVVTPAILSMIWFAVFGGMGLSFAQEMPIDYLTQLVSAPENALFAVLSSFPAGQFLSVFALVIIVIFFITSADSATYVLGVMSSRGEENPPSSMKIIWGIAQALVALALLIAGGIKALQTFSIAAAFPFIFIMAAACIGLIKEFWRERAKTPKALAVSDGVPKSVSEVDVT